MEVITTKSQIRQIMRAKRAKLSLAQQQQAAAQVATKIIQSQIFKTSQNIACYMAKGAELNVQPIITEVWHSNKHCYLPIVRFDKSGFLHFVEYLADDKLIPNRFGILEPKLQQEKLISARDLDLVIVPLIAFDLQGNRIGTGGGYYDHTFAFLNDEPDLKKPLLLGVAYACQQLPQIDSQPWDVKMQRVMTEKEIYKYL